MPLAREMGVPSQSANYIAGLLVFVIIIVGQFFMNTSLGNVIGPTTLTASRGADTKQHLMFELVKHMIVGGS